MSSKITNAYIRLSIQSALIGAIGKSVIGVCFTFNETIITITVYVEGTLSEVQKDELENFSILVHADTYPSITRVELEIICDAVEPLPSKGIWVFLQMGYRTIKKDVKTPENK